VDASDFGEGTVELGAGGGSGKDADLKTLTA